MHFHNSVLCLVSMFSRVQFCLIVEFILAWCLFIVNKCPKKSGSQSLGSKMHIIKHFKAKNDLRKRGSESLGSEIHVIKLKRLDPCTEKGSHGSLQEIHW